MKPKFLHKERSDDFRLIEELDEIRREFSIDENLMYYEPWDYMRARQEYMKYRWKEVTDEKYGRKR